MTIPEKQSLRDLGFRPSNNETHYWHWSGRCGIALDTGLWFPCDMFDNGDLQYADLGFENPIEAANYSKQFFT